MCSNLLVGRIGKRISADEWNDRRSKEANESATSPRPRKMRFRATENSRAISIKINFRGVNGPDPPLSVLCHEIRRIAGGKVPGAEPGGLSAQLRRHPSSRRASLAK